LDDDELDEGPNEIVGEDRDAWRDIPGRTPDVDGAASAGKGKGKVGVHQGLTHV
jgi:hypothetical protein